MKCLTRNLLVSTVFCLSTAQAFASYPMICRGGGNMRVNNFVQLYPTATGTSMQPTIDIFFKKSLTPSGLDGENLKEGECSWLDRAINDAEPSAISDQYLTGSSISISSQTTMTTKTLDIASLYSQLTGPNGAKFFVKLWVGGSGGPFLRDGAQPVKTFFKP